MATVGIDELTDAAMLVKSDAVAWRGDTELLLREQGVKVLEVPIGQPSRAHRRLRKSVGCVEVSA